MSALLEVDGLKKHFALRRGFWGGASAHVYAVDGVSFHIDKGETLALVGESGCGKSTVGRAALRLFEITAGRVVLDGLRIDAAGALRPLRRRMQVVFQDPFSSLNPRMRVRDILAEPIRNFGLASSPADLDARIDALLDTVRLPREAARRRPHEFSGGQRQRIGIARALAAEPDLIVCDEAVSAPSGCRFHTRCPYAFDRCRTGEPSLRLLADGQSAACHLNDLPAAQNPMARDADVLPDARGGADGAYTARSRAAP